MALIPWGPKYEIGIKSIDSQHEKLVGYINQLNDAMSEGKGSEIVELILKNLVEYTETHFVYEEKLFEAHDYSKEKEHRRLHSLLVQDVKDFKTKFENGDSELTEEMMAFLKDWLENHILIEDKKYVTELKSKGVS
ncbi:MAG: bacteriohemerythrin [Bdellovibrionales bacterium]|nr:bacteriohemerythrin [Bdellovibrionales bacterium]